MKQINLAAAGLVLTVLMNTGTVAAQKDPGPRGGPPGAGGVLTGVSAELQTFFKAAIADFMEVDSVSGSVSGEIGSGLGPTFNGNSCAQCHAHPAVGGSSPPTNPQVALAVLDGAQNTGDGAVVAAAVKHTVNAELRFDPPIRCVLDGRRKTNR